MIRDLIWPHVRLGLRLCFLLAVGWALADAWGKISTFDWAALTIAGVDAVLYAYLDETRNRSRDRKRRAWRKLVRSYGEDEARSLLARADAILRADVGPR